MVLFGADRVGEFGRLFEGRVALLTGPSGRTGGNVPTIDVLRQCCDLRLLLAPEHGVRGDKAAGALFADEVDPESGLTVRSLYTWRCSTPWFTTWRTWVAGIIPS